MNKPQRRNKGPRRPRIALRCPVKELRKCVCGHMVDHRYEVLGFEGAARCEHHDVALVPINGAVSIGQRLVAA